MFTGIIEAIGRVKSVEKKGASGRIIIEVSIDLARENVNPLKGVAPGDSISVNGACLTVTEIKKGVEGGHPLEGSHSLFSADMSAETLRLTTLGTIKSGAKVNLEAALTLSKPLGGHIVTGHVDGIGTIRKKSVNGQYIDLEVNVPEKLMIQIVKKGSVAVDGISLTVTEVGRDFFKTAIIPHTLEKTALSSKTEGSAVNIETDVLAKYVERLLGARDGKKAISVDFLREQGFFKK